MNTNLLKNESHKENIHNLHNQLPSESLADMTKKLDILMMENQTIQSNYNDISSEMEKLQDDLAERDAQVEETQSSAGGWEQEEESGSGGNGEKKARWRKDRYRCSPHALLKHTRLRRHTHTHAHSWFTPDHPSLFHSPPPLFPRPVAISVPVFDPAMVREPVTWVHPAKAQIVVSST